VDDVYVAAFNGDVSDRSQKISRNDQATLKKV
jgi:hypothetical protein